MNELQKFGKWQENFIKGIDYRARKNALKKLSFWQKLRLKKHKQAQANLVAGI